MESLFAWLTEHVGVLRQLGGLWIALGIGSFILTLMALPFIIVRLPVDYFTQNRRVSAVSEADNPVLAWLLRALKNTLGILLILFGAIMLFIPGQGVLTMLIGVLLTNFPGKYRLERRLVRRPSVLRALNAIRGRFGHDPLLPASSSDDE